MRVATTTHIKVIEGKAYMKKGLVYHPGRRHAAAWFVPGKNTAMVDVLLVLRVYSRYIKRMYGLDLKAIAELTGSDNMSYLSRRIGYWCRYGLTVQAGVALDGSKCYVLGEHGFNYLTEYVPRGYKTMAVDEVIQNAKSIAEYLRVRTYSDKEVVYKKQVGGAIAWKLQHVVKPLVTGDGVMDAEDLEEVGID